MPFVLHPVAPPSEDVLLLVVEVRVMRDAWLVLGVRELRWAEVHAGENWFQLRHDPGHQVLGVGTLLVALAYEGLGVVPVIFGPCLQDHALWMDGGDG